MKKIFIKDFENNQILENEIFAVADFSQKSTRNGNSYWDLILTDKTGQINAKVWEDNFKNCAEIKVKKVVMVNAEVTQFNGNLQLIIKDLSIVDEKNIDVSDFIGQTQKDIETLYKNAQKHLKSIKNKDLKKLLDYFYENKEFVQKIKTQPGAQNIHHAYSGGLLEHITEMLDMSDYLTKAYAQINIELLKTAILLHDIGKIPELKVTTIIERTEKGKLLGHLALSLEMVNEALLTLQKFPEELKLHLLHLVASHHGRLEFGSPVQPMTTEAFALHYLDQISAKINTSYYQTQATREKGERFSPRIFALETSVFAPTIENEKEGKNSETLFD